MHLRRLIRVPRCRSHRIRNIRSRLVLRPHQATHQLTKTPINHEFVLVEVFQTGRTRVIPLRTIAKPRRDAFSERLLQNRQVPASRPLD